MVEILVQSEVIWQFRIWSRCQVLKRLTFKLLAPEDFHAKQCICHLNTNAPIGTNGIIMVQNIQVRMSTGLRVSLRHETTALSYCS